MTVPLPKAYSYIRFSTPEQAKGDSYRRQREAAEKYCALNGLQLVGTKEYLFFDKGKSAFKGKHLDDSGELARFLAYVDQGVILPGSYLIVESLDRLSRERVKDALPRFLDLLNKGIRIYTSADNKLYSDDYNDVDLIVSIVQMSRAHNESSLKGHRVSKAWQQKQHEARENKKPLGHACPYWLRFNGQKYEVIPERALVVELIFKLAASGLGHRAIAKTLNQENIPIFGSINRNKTGLWASSSTGKILSNRALLGEYQPTGLVDGVRSKIGEPVTDFFPTVISEEKFYEAQAARATRRVSKSTKTTKNFNVWQSIARCALCGESLHLVNKGRPPKGNKYLRCYGYAKGRCANKQVPLAHAEAAYKEILAKVDSLSLVQDSQAKIQKEIAAIDLKLGSIASREEEISTQVLELGGRLPKTILLSLSRLEEEASVLSLRRGELKEDAQREKIINKQDFFERLDLVTFEGRARANYLLKTIGVIVKVRRSDSSIFYVIEVDGVASFLMTQKGENISYYPYTREVSELLKTQGDAETFDAKHGEMILDLNDLLGKIDQHMTETAVLSKICKTITLD